MIHARYPLALLALVLTGASAPQERIVEPGGIVAAIVNGVPGRMRIDPGGTALPLIATDVAERAGLKKDTANFSYAVGPEQVRGPAAVTMIDLGTGPMARRVGWTARRYAPDIDGVVGAGGLPDAIVRFRLRAEGPGERIFTFPMLEQGGLFGSFGERFGSIAVGGTPMRVRFDPYAPRSLATAGAGMRIAVAPGGTISGAAEPAPIAFGIMRPVRSLQLGTPLVVGPVALARLGVRIADFGSATRIAEAGADPDEVIVAARGRHDPSHDRLTIGADVLTRCSSIQYDKPGRVIRLTCA